MTRVLTRTMVLKELDGVANRLAAEKITGKQRLELLRRQAQLGDLRDALADRARRTAA